MKTKDLIADTLVDLYRIDSAKRISVSEVLKASGINRSSFYYHFSSIDDVNKYIIDRFFEGLSEAFKEATYICINKADVPELWHTPVLNFYLENKNVCSYLLYSSNRNRFEIAYIDKIIAISESYRIKTENDSTFWNNQLRLYSDRMMAYQCFSFLAEWAHNGFDLSPEDLSNIVYILSNIGDANSVMEKKPHFIRAV